jgi:acetoacetate decarboxylase
MTDGTPTNPAVANPAGARPGDVIGLPKLVLRYPTDPDAIAALLPPGLEPCGEPLVQLNVYCVPVHGEPEHGISTKVPARFGDLEGSYCLGIGIDQESAIFVSRETNGQPKFPCDVRYFRLGAEVHASATHQGTTFMTYRGSPAGTVEPDGAEHTEHEFWIKVSRAVGGGGGFDLPPQVVLVTTSGVRTRTELLDGELVLRDSDWDPYTALLPPRGPATAELVSTRHTGRSISPAGTLDPDAFEPFADTIGGSRWPGDRGAPRRPASAPGGAR